MAWSSRLTSGTCITQQFRNSSINSFRESISRSLNRHAYSFLESICFENMRGIKPVFRHKLLLTHPKSEKGTSLQSLWKNLWASNLKNSCQRKESGGCQAGGGGGWAKWVRGSGRYRLPVMEGVSHGHERHSIRNRADSTVPALCGDRWQLPSRLSTEYADGLVKSLRCTPESNVILCVNYASTKKKLP